MKRIKNSAVCIILALVIALSSVSGLQVNAQVASEGRPLAEHYQSIIDVFGAAYRFADFMADRQDAARPDAEYIISAADYTIISGMESRLYEDFEGMPGISVWTDEEGIITWEVDVAEGGLYHLAVTYFNVPGRNTEIQRAILINGELPFFQATSVQFYRTWVNELDYIVQDANGNDLRPTQTEYRLWREVGIRDASGQHNEYLSFYFNEGRNTITFLSQREPVLIHSLRIFQMPEILSYAEVSADFTNLPRPGIGTIRIEGQDAVRRSTPRLAPRANMAGPGVYPFNPRNIVINYSGGSPWSEPGMWIEWEFEVPESGLYNIAMNVQQNFHRGAMSYRRISINGEVPFAELEAVPFGFNNRWRVDTLGGAEYPFLFYFEAGTHTIRMDVVLGGYAPYLREIQEAITNLTRIHRQVVMITGLDPDQHRDYQIGRRIPTLRDDLTYEKERLQRTFEGLSALSGGNLSERDVLVRNTYQALETMLRNVDDIPRRLGDLNQRIAGLGTWILQVQEQSLSIDGIYILSVDAPTPTNTSNFWSRLWHGIVSLVLSFMIDFYSMGDPEVGGRTIEVWIGSGRDQAIVLRSMIDETFTRETGIGVNLMLVDMGMLLPATVSGQGPDVALGMGMALPMNFAFRGAVADISGFPGFDEVVQRFPEAAIVPFMYQDSVFALPETLTFNMLFYRRDILHYLGLEPPDTWDDVRASIAVLDHNHRNFGMPADTMDDIMRSFGMFLMQNGGTFYTPDGRATMLATDESLSAFRDFTRFYSDYELPRVFNFVNQFRTGEMPMAIQDYTAFNTLQVFAPEINGLWGFRPIPGTPQPDGSINRAGPSGGTGVIMMEQSDDKYAAWEFMEWWTRAETQVQFGTLLESVMGPAARHATANLEAFAMMPWAVRDYRSLMAQFGYVQGIPQVPGAYLTPRYIRNAWAEVVIDEEREPRDALRSVVRLIDEEITIKRREFGLD